MNDLTACPSCHRHARPGPACPFCGAQLTKPTRPRRVKAASRAAIFAVALGASACGDTDTGEDAGVADAGQVDSGPEDAGNVAMPYGAPPVDHLI